MCSLWGLVASLKGFCDIAKTGENLSSHFAGPKQMLTSRLYLSKTREMPFESQMKMHFGSLTLFMDEKTAVALEFLTCSSVREG